MYTVMYMDGDELVATPHLTMRMAARTRDIAEYEHGYLAWLVVDRNNPFANIKHRNAE